MGQRFLRPSLVQRIAGRAAEHIFIELEAKLLARACPKIQKESAIDLVLRPEAAPADLSYKRRDLVHIPKAESAIRKEIGKWTRLLSSSTVKEKKDSSMPFS
jgi:hypothetical protein